MAELICPVCGGRLTRGAAVWRCEKGHSFDVARQGYVNLLPVTQKHSRQPGDPKPRWTPDGLSSPGGSTHPSRKN